MANHIIKRMNKVLAVKRLLLLLCVILISSCNYGFKGSAPPEGIKTIFVPAIKDQSNFGLPTLGEDLTTLLKTKFIKDNTLEYSEKTSADGMVTCVVTSVKDDPLVISSGEQVSKRKVTVIVNVEFQNLKTKKDIWKKDFTNWGEYDSSTGGFSKRDDGVKVAIDKLTDDILLDVVSNW
jgi:hypothetical protein